MGATEQLLKCKNLVVKVASRCNLNCSYCYMYNMGDLTYKNQPKVMSSRTVRALMNRVLNHCLNTNLKRFYFALHGGEPLLAGKDFFRMYVYTAREILLPHVTPRFYIQTNGVLLSEEWCELFNELEIQISVSLDGNKEANDKYRVDHAGRGSYDDVIKGLKISQAHSVKSTGVLSVVNIDSNPEDTYDFFKSLGIGAIDYLLPDGNHSTPPPSPPKDKGLSEDSPYGDWLTRVFDRWFDEPEQRLRVRFFEFIMAAILGMDQASDNLGIQNNEIMVIETDGSMEAVDVLKICGDGFTKAGANVHTHEFEDAMKTDLANLYYLSHKKLPAQCLKCPVNEICGGGFLPHRYSKEKGFNNPSYYCKDLLKVITHIQNRVLSNLPQELLVSADVTPLSYKEALNRINDNLAQLVEPEYVKELESF